MKRGCIICGEPIQYFADEREMSCSICGKPFRSDAACANGHFVCNRCHAEEAYKAITQCALQSSGKDPLGIAEEMMRSAPVHMHGPEHHYLVPAALLAAYANCGGRIELASALTKALERARRVPGGVCGNWGCCGAGVGVGIFVSVVTGASPLAEEEWKLANIATAQSLLNISEHGGPRCCKRDSWLAIGQATVFAAERLGVEFEKPANIVCSFFPDNAECIRERCPYYAAS